jgi:AcrR family transcriptional regulator
LDRSFRDSPVERQLLAAAARLFARKGFDGVSVSQIVDAAALTKGALYHYFESKNDLLYEIYRALLTRQLADLDRITGGGLPPAETLRLLITELVKSAAAGIDESKVWAREMHRLDEAHLLAVRIGRRGYHDRFRQIVEAAQVQGELSSSVSPETVTLIVLSMVDQMPQWYRPDGPKSPAEIAGEVCAFVFAALRPE